MSVFHSIYGKMFGYRPSNGELVIYNPASDAQEIAGITGHGTINTFTSSGQTLKPYGTNIINHSTAVTYTLPTPAGRGRLMTITSISASTAQTVSISSANGVMLTTAGTSAGHVAIFKGVGASVNLREGSTYWIVLSKPTTDAVHFTS